MNEGQAAFPLVDDDSAFETSLELEHESDLLFNDESSLSKEPPLSLQEKVENFMKYGHLDTVEGKPDQPNFTSLYQTKISTTAYV